MNKYFTLFLLSAILLQKLSGQNNIINYGSSWKYLDNGTNQGTAWRTASFNDASWASGNAQLGYGDGDEATVVSYGPNANKKYITTYFRKTISVADASLFTSFTLSIKRDDGAVVYINGVEKFRTNMPAGTISSTTKASADAVDDGNTSQTISLPSGTLATGTNVIAVEVHQRIANNADISFDLQLLGNVIVSAPTVNSLSPADNSTNIATTSNLVLTFNKTVQKGTGNILVKEGGVITQTLAVSSTAITVAGNVVTIDPADFANGASVNIEIAAGVFKDLENNNYAGIADMGTWNFNVLFTDLVPPTVTNYSPADKATNVSVSSNLILTFNETVQKGGGNILIKEAGIITQTIDVWSASITVSGNLVTINPADLGYAKAINIELAPGAFKDLANNNYGGITDAVSWNFNTEDQVTIPQTIVAYGAAWKYLDNGTNQGTAWTGTLFNDAGWASGYAQLGYGDGDEATNVSYGPNASAKYITTYFRKTISISNPSAFAFSGSVKRDDGIIIYVNGAEVYRNNMPTGTITYTTLATAAASDDGNTAQAFTINASAFVSGNNLIAVEMHQNLGTSSDLSFDLQLTGNVPGAALLTRGPYMNSALQNGIVIRWRSDVATDSKLNYGTSAGNLTQSFTDNALTTEHIITLTGLTANTLYYYSIGSSTQTLQGDANNYFKTMPVAGSTQKIRIMAMGDMGNNSANQANVRNAWQTFNGSNYTDAWILLGDNAYESGTDAEFQTNFFNNYQESLTKNHVLWPSPGNHDYANSAARQADHLIAYYDMFTLPKNGEAGGIASNTEAFYSYNYGNVHFVALDSYGWETGNTRLYDTLGAQAVWLKKDLAANTQPWTVVYFHHPPFSKGGHNSDTDVELTNIRQRIVPILERYKVDLVLNGHSHIYERSYLLNGYYGLESTFNLATHALSSSSAKYDGTANSCIYIKNASDTRNGVVYAVVGSAGELGGTTTGYPHNAMYYSNNTVGGTLYFEVENNHLTAKWIGADGVIRDNFTIMKNVNQTSSINITSGNSTTLTASWLGNYSWSNGATTQSITVSPAANTTYTVTDGKGCITDVFNVQVASPFRSIFVYEQTKSFLNVIPGTLQKGQLLNVQSGLIGPTEFILADINGRILNRYKSSGNVQIQTSNLLPGIYFVKWDAKGKAMTRKFVIIN